MWPLDRRYGIGSYSIRIRTVDPADITLAKTNKNFFNKSDFYSNSV